MVRHNFGGMGGVAASASLELMLCAAGLMRRRWRWHIINEMSCFVIFVGVNVWINNMGCKCYQASSDFV